MKFMAIRASWITCHDILSQLGGCVDGRIVQQRAALNDAMRDDEGNCLTLCVYLRLRFSFISLCGCPLVQSPAGLREARAQHIDSMPKFRQWLILAPVRINPNQYWIHAATYLDAS
jgi:hypothetical protein